jgi:hypothetical protein
MSLSKSGQKLIDQISHRWPNATFNIDQSEKSRSFTVNIESPRESWWLTEQIAAFCKRKSPGYVRLSYLKHNSFVFDASNQGHFWEKITSSEEGIGNYIEVGMSTHGEKDDMPFDIPILSGKALECVPPLFDKLRVSINLNLASSDVYNLACRMKELGFIDGPVLPEGRQRYPHTAIRGMQDYIGLPRSDYDTDLHWLIWNELRISSL